MIKTNLLCVLTLAITAALGPQLAAQVQTEVPPAVPGAMPVTVEHIKIHGAALEGNLEGDAADRDVFVFLPPSYAKEKPACRRLGKDGWCKGREDASGEIDPRRTKR